MAQKVTDFQNVPQGKGFCLDSQQLSSGYVARDISLEHVVFSLSLFLLYMLGKSSIIEGYLEPQYHSFPK